jgi:putative ABC transport system permease protein
LLGETVLGGRVKVDNSVFKVIGIMENNLGTQFPELNSPNDMIVIPRRTAESFFGFSTFEREGRNNTTITNVEADLFLVRVMDLAYIDDTAKRIISYLEKAHPRDKDWGVTVPIAS